MGSQGVVGLEITRGRLDFVEQCGQCRSTVAGELATGQVEGLNPVGAFIDRRDTHIAQQLRGTGLFDKAHATMHLNTQRGNVHGLISGERLDHRNQYINTRLGRLSLSAIHCMARHVQLGCTVQRQGAQGVGTGTHGEQHAPYIKMYVACCSPCVPVPTPCAPWRCTVQPSWTWRAMQWMALCERRPRRVLMY